MAVLRLTTQLVWSVLVVSISYWAVPNEQTSLILSRMNLPRLCKFVLAAAPLLVALPVHANILQPGDTNKAPDVFTLPNANPPVLGEISGTFNIGNGTITGSWEEAVLVDPLGITCPGCLVFGFDITVDQASRGSVFGLNLARYFSYTTDVGYLANVPGVPPTSVSRGPFGGGIGFNMVFQNQAINPGSGSAVMVVATNATTFDRGGNLIINGFSFASSSNISTQIGDLFEPTLIPEPSTALLFGLGLLGIAALRKRRCC